MSAPIKTLSSGKIQIAEWPNDKYDSTSFTFKKNYKTKDDEWKSTDFMSLADLMDVLVLCHKVLEARIKEKGKVSESCESPI